MSSFKVLAVTNRKLSGSNFLEQIDKIAKAKPSGIILREKDLSHEEYEKLARQVMEICKDNNVKCILHSFLDISKKLGCRSIHIPLPILRKEAGNLNSFDTVGTSVHSLQEALEAEKLCASYITAGHIFSTDCKKGLAPRGLEFLMDVHKNVNTPVYAIGGITTSTVKDIFCLGVEGVCIMSGLMKCINPSQYLANIRQME